MKFRSVLLITGCFLFSLSYAQVPVLLKSGKMTPAGNISQKTIQDFYSQVKWSNGKTTAFIQFNAIPSEMQRKALLADGVELLDYIPSNTYLVSFSKQPEASALQRSGAISVFQLTPEQKMQPQLSMGVIPVWAKKPDGRAELWISYPKSFSFSEISSLLAKQHTDITATDYEPYRVLGILVSPDKIKDIASLPYISYVQPAPHADQPLNFISRTNSKANVLNAAASVGGLDLNGEGVVIGVGDDSDPKYHIDFTGRLINRAGYNANMHGTHVMGTVTGNGNILEQYRGYASRSIPVAQYFSGILSNTPAYVADYNMVITNNSYGEITGDCSYAGVYDLLSMIVDLQEQAFPKLQHVFAAGNDGASVNCSPYPAGFQTVLGSYQSSKNALIVGSTEKDLNVSDFSSKGPVKDGRIKPEVMSYGRFLISTYPFNSYGYSSGTSMASPGVSGGLALLYQRYRQLNGGTDPDNGLMKAIVCNGANDVGNTGADYSSGYGQLNLLRSIDILNNSRYFISSVNNGSTNNHSVVVPANTAQLKVMLYWNDPAAMPFAATTLINDLDLEVADPSSSLHYPWQLDATPANVNNPATTGADHVNNMEQVVITNPSSGTYTVNVKGTAVTQAPPQKYYVVYDLVPVSTQLSYPIGGEGLNPGETATIEWESYGDPANTFTLEYSTDNGGSWTTINNNIAASLRQLDWVVPNVPTDQALIRLTRNSTAMVSTSQPFTILGVPTASLAATQCEGYISLNWTPVSGAADYEVFRLIGNEMNAVGTTTGTNYIFSGLSADSTYWVSVRARINGKAGRRAQAISRQPNDGTCAGSISDNDLKMDAILAPVSGRIATSTALTASTSIQVRIKNLDDAAVTGFDVRYSVNGGAWNTETVNTTVSGGAAYTHTFSATYDFSAPGIYVLKAEVINVSGSDPVSENNVITDTIKQIANNPVTLPFTDNIESATGDAYLADYIGVNGIERYDYQKSNEGGRFSTFLNSGIAYSGSKAISLDRDGGTAPGGNINYVTGTFNLAGVDASTQDIRLDVEYKQHGDSVGGADNAIWVRGTDLQPWIKALDLSANGNVPGIYKKTKSIEIADLLFANGQNFSSSFQVRLGQFGYVRISDDYGFQGNSFDDIHLYQVNDDIQMIAIDTPIVNSCALSNATPVRVRVRNAASTTINNIPVKFSVDGGAFVTENIPSIAGDATLSYTFTATADLSATGPHTVKVIVNYPSDDFPDNDTAVVNLVNSPLVNSFPYLEGFESGNGNWYSSGTHNSWEYGTPASTKINRAANGTKAWKTSLNGNYNNNETSYLYSPCFDISGMTNPTLSFSMAADLENCGATLCDGAYVEYSSDGVNWTKLGAFGSGTNWYNKPGDEVWSIEDYTRWHVATSPLPTGFTTLRLRFVISSDPFVNREGLAVDDIHIYDNTMGIYDGATMGAPVTQNIPGGTNWIDFTSGGKLVASVQPNSLNMGSTDVQAYINTAAVRNDGQQYYHDRNITIKPANTTLADSVSVRFYFLDNETENLINASGCAACTKPSMAYELGVSKFTHTNKTIENGTISDNSGGTWLYIPSDQVNKVPFDKGYYAEFKVKDFSEFWLNNGGLNNMTTLPVKLESFAAEKQARNDVAVTWKTANEYNVHHYEIEVAKGNQNYQAGSFVKIGEVRSAGNTAAGRDYSITDTETGKSGTRYYRLKVVENDGTVFYSSVRALLFTDEMNWQVFPNPSRGLFSLAYQLNTDEGLTLRVFDAHGKLVKQLIAQGTGFISRIAVDLSGETIPSGLYLLETTSSAGKSQVFRLIKQ